MSGLFITFEGTEGCGKTTQIKFLEDFLKLKSHDVVVTREPGGTRIGEQIRRILLAVENKSMLAVTELLLYAAARSQHVQEVIKPALAEGRIVLCDRFADATRAYQGAARKIDEEYLNQIHTIATGGLVPDLTILLDCPAEIGLKRAWDRNEREKISGKEDRFEQEALDFHERVRNGYLKIASEEPNRLKVVSALEPTDVIHQKIVQEVMKVVIT